MGKNKREKITYGKIYAKLKLAGGNQIPDKNNFENWFSKGKINSSLYGKLNRIKKGQKDKRGNIKYKIIEKRSEPIEFRVWYCKKYYEQEGLCKYCKIPQEYLLKIYGRPDGFREGDNGKGKRGKTLEIDRPENEDYNENCVLACYPCNNAKSDVFNPHEFEKISKVIQGIWVEKAKTKGLLKEILKKYPSLKQ